MFQTNSNLNNLSPDSLQVLLTKAKAISAVNADSLAFIRSRKGQQVITRRAYFLRPKQRKLNNSASELSFTTRDAKQDIDSIVKSWKYKGKSFTKESIAINNFIDNDIKGFDDLERLQDEYEKLLEVYSRILVDEPESRKAAMIALENMELLQIAIGETHTQVTDVRNDVEDNMELDAYVKSVGEAIEGIKGKGVSFKVYIDEMTQRKEENEIHTVEFDDITKLKFRDVFTTKTSIICMEPYILKNEQYLAVGLDNGEIDLLAVRDYSKIATLKGHRNCVQSLVSYEHRGVQMLASGSDDKTIKIWDLSTKQLIHTIKGHGHSVSTLQVQYIEEKLYLISGSDDKTMKVWDLDSNELVKTMECGMSYIKDMKVFYRNHEPHIAVGTMSGLRIWSLIQYKEVAKLDEKKLFTSLAITDHNGVMMLAGCCSEKCIKIWSLENYSEMQRIDLNNIDYCCYLEFVQSNGKLYLVHGDKGRCIQVWDVESKTSIFTVNTECRIDSMVAIEKDGYAYFLTGDRNGTIKLWSD